MIQIEFLKKELSVSQTQSTALESELKRKNETCQLLEERVKSLEHPAVANLLNSYLPTNSETSSEAHDNQHQCANSQIMQKVVMNIKLLSDQVQSLDSRLSSFSHLQPKDPVVTSETKNQDHTGQCWK